MENVVQLYDGDDDDDEEDEEVLSEIRKWWKLVWQHVMNESFFGVFEKLEYFRWILAPQI